MSPRLLLDTHMVLVLLQESRLRIPAAWREVLEAAGAVRLVSVATLWEIAIKVRQGKLGIHFPLEQMPHRMEEFGLRLVDVRTDHVLHRLEIIPPTSDPFDRLLLATSAVEGARLLTRDDKLVDHPLAWRPEGA